MMLMMMRDFGRDAFWFWTMDLQLPTPDDFPAFPYQPPYSIQIDLMRHLYASIEQKKVTIIESPTGTGKTLTLLCSSLTWLVDERDRARKGKMRAIAGGDEIDAAKDWVVEQTLARVRREMEADERDYEEKLAKARKKEQQLRRMAAGRMNKRVKYANVAARAPGEPVSSKARAVEDEDDSIFLPEDEPTNDDGGEFISPELRALMEKVDRIQRSRHLHSEEEEVACTKIYYASRTHSQLTQVLPEMSKLKLKQSVSVTNYHDQGCTSEPSSLPRKRSLSVGEDDDNQDECGTNKQFRTVSLGSRKQLCINEELKAKSRDLDEACRELLGEKAGKRCQYLPPAGEEVAMLDFRDQILVGIGIQEEVIGGTDSRIQAVPKDIEDLAEAGRLANICPYFGSRKAIPQAELVTLPYNLLLQKSAREALGIDLKDQVVIIDEAHNLIPTLLSLSTNVLSYSSLTVSLQQVCTYVQRFKNRLSAVNMLHLKRLVVFLDALKKAASEWRDHRVAALKNKQQKVEKSEVLTVVDFMGRLGKKASSINLLEIESYLKKSKIARKISGYAEKQAEKEEADAGSSRKAKRGTLPPLHAVEDFMVSLSHPNDDGRVTFTLIEVPGQEATVELRYQLLNPAPNFLEVVQDARAVVLAGAGMIVFFPSYSFLNHTKEIWAKTKTLERFAVKKTVFFEPQESTDVDTVLREYAAAVQGQVPDKKGGALLFAVIGAKLSEGLNFADDLARAVVIVGLPFPNLGSPELRERMKYVKMLEEKRLIGSADTNKREPGKDAAAELYENMCMNAVNQSIGRAIRHRNDWASLLLLDRRYANPSIRNKLPKWIRKELVVSEGFGQTIKDVAAFSSQRRKLATSS
ncbi:hypothetical protein EST38_g1370 [Candolleomyces aberdarensis]|uniref:ATP-dependent DNA helicase CHL1 n=1 Tax=Candolleomyces aberdarensis TaxID=2316362 RepID=A0A4Q2DVY5_9AGAR|nr:hypothetical protein EST38_g1370 [Candolleomyces aberdarensis]